MREALRRAPVRAFCVSVGALVGVLAGYLFAVAVGADPGAGELVVVQDTR